MKIYVFAVAALLAGCQKEPDEQILNRLNEINSRIDTLQDENKALTEAIERLKIEVSNNCRA